MSLMSLYDDVTAKKSFFYTSGEHQLHAHLLFPLQLVLELNRKGLQFYFSSSPSL